MHVDDCSILSHNENHHGCAVEVPPSIGKGLLVAGDIRSCLCGYDGIPSEVADKGVGKPRKHVRTKIILISSNRTSWRNITTVDNRIHHEI